MRKMLCLLILALSLTACGKEGTAAPAALPPDTETAVSETAVTETAAETAAGVPGIPEAEYAALGEPVAVASGDVGVWLDSQDLGWLEVSRYQLPQYATDIFGDGVFYLCTDPPEMNQGSHYGVFTLEEELFQQTNFTVERNYRIFGVPLRMRFDFCEYAPGKTALTYVPPVDDQDFRYFRQDPAEGWLVGADLRSEGLEYPLLLNPYTGELTDFLAEVPNATAVLPEPPIYWCSLGPENRFLCQGKEGRYFYFDVPGGKFYDLNELTGGELAGISAVWARNRALCWDGSGNAWTVELDTLEATQVLTGADLWGLRMRTVLDGASFLLERLPEGGALVHDYLTDTTVHLDRLLPDDTIDAIRYSPDGRKVSWAVYVNQQEDHQVVWDCDTRRLITNVNTMENIQWTRDNRLAMWNYDGLCFVYTLKEN